MKRCIIASTFNLELKSMNHFCKKQTQRRTSVVLCALLLMVMVFSNLFIIFEHDHECSGDDCPICILLQQAEKNVTCLGEAEHGGIPYLFLTPASNVQTCILPFYRYALPLTLIYLKVQQNK